MLQRFFICSNYFHIGMTKVAISSVDSMRGLCNQTAVNGTARRDHGGGLLARKRLTPHLLEGDALKLE